MPARVLPPNDELRRMRDKGMTHQQIADEVMRMTGYPVATATVSAALHRAGLTAKGKRYPDELPWVVKSQHQDHYAARMLRLLGRMRQGAPLSHEAKRRLDGWLNQLADHSSVVVYVPDTKDGFFYVEGAPDNKDGIPVDRDWTLSGPQKTTRRR